MPELNITNSAGRDAVININGVREPLRVRWLDANGRPASSVRLIKATFQHDLQSLLRSHKSLPEIGSQLIASDPEIDFESVGGFLQNTSRVLTDQVGNLIHKSQAFEIVRNPDGSIRERRPKGAVSPNVTADSPIRWTGKMIKKSEAIRKFVFSNKVQLTHINGLTYDFLFNMAKELEQQNSLLIVGAGPKSNQPLILRRGSTPYRGFLEGRTEGDRYCLILHLSNLELKMPEPSSETSESPNS